MMGPASMGLPPCAWDDACGQMDAAQFERVVCALKAGKPALFPTDTVYGLGVSVLHARTPEALYALKKRAAGKPVAWLVGGPGALDEFGADVPEEAKELARLHWPGALTIIVKAGDAVPEAFLAASGTVGLRMPASPAALALIEAVGGPLATSSANLSGNPDPRSFDEIDTALLKRVPAAMRFDACQSGVPSTVVDCSQGLISVVRQGGIAVER